MSINPFAHIAGLYTKDVMMEHLNLPPGEISQPHVFQVGGGGAGRRARAALEPSPPCPQIAAAAYHGLRGDRANQAVIISGESGAGKTEATKKCLEFFTHAAGSTGVGLEEKVRCAA